VTIYLADQVDGSAIRFIAETAVEPVHMLKPKAVRLENGMVPITSQDILTFLCHAVEKEV
jgi:hypothetical protein